jgi:hypothetical protein
MKSVLKPRLWQVVLLGSVIFVQGAIAQPSVFDRLGVNHLITARILPAEKPRAPEEQAQISGLKIVMRVSDHAREVQFFGEIPVEWPDFDAAKGAAEQVIWEDKQCHQRRGLPKLTVLTVEASLDVGQSHFQISASHRRIGRQVPGDEVRPDQALQIGRDDGGRFFAFRAKTTESHVAVLLKIYEVDCILN